MDNTLLLALIALLGLILGSFANVVIYRLPRIIEQEWQAELEAYLVEQGIKPDSASPTPSLSLSLPRSHRPQCATPIRYRELIPVLSWLLLRGRCSHKPFLGICIGQQMLFEHSEEGNVPGLGIFKGEVRRFPADKMVAADGSRLKVPHMGWNEVWQKQAHPLWTGIEDGARFYYVHSYYVDPADQAIVAATTDYGIPFTGAVAQANIFAIQFHPEKSAQAGLQLLSNFMCWKP